jgi:hypothetical protein
MIKKLKDYVDAGRDHYEIARWLINLNINKHIPMSLDDLADTSTVANEVEAIVECIQESDYEDAINVARESAVVILQEEGFDVDE